MSSLRRTGLFRSVSLATVGALAACGGDSGGDTKADASVSASNPVTGGSSIDDTLTLHFAPMYSAYDGMHDFQLPVIVEEDVTGVTFSASDPSMVDVSATADGAMLTMRKSGKVQIIATTPDGQRGSAVLTITAATPQDWQTGSDRYNNGIGLDGGTGRAVLGGGGLSQLNTNLACTTCHGPTAPLASTFGDVEHTPEQTGGYSDDDLIKIFTMAQKPPGIGQHTNVPLSAWQAFHKWTVDDSQKKGLVVYLRSLTPKDEGTAVDFGGFQPRGRGDGGLPRGPGRNGDGGVGGGGTAVVRSLDGGT